MTRSELFCICVFLSYLVSFCSVHTHQPILPEIVESESESRFLLFLRQKAFFSVPVSVKMSSSKVVPTSESKSGKIYANTEQRRTLMAIYLADNYPDTSILEQVTMEIRFKTLVQNQLSQNNTLFCFRYPMNLALAWTG